MAISRNFGQKMAEEVLHESFTTGLHYEGLWALVMKMSSAEVASFLAEHVRAHFSGLGRDGVVRIVEEEDRFRLIFDPCGSGQAMRLREVALTGKSQALPQSSPYTWGLEGKVPAYCSHCAVNEFEGLRRLGFPVFVVEFDPDPNKPCGWTIYKDPNLIPEHYFKRLGAKRDPTKFKKLKN
jgi:hypothetical protein